MDRGGAELKAVFGDFCSGRIWFATESEGTWRAEQWAETGIGISSFGEDENGELYVTDLGRGEVHRFTGPTGPEVRRASGRRVVPTDAALKVGQDPPYGNHRPR